MFEVRGCMRLIAATVLAVAPAIVRSEGAAAADPLELRAISPSYRGQDFVGRHLREEMRPLFEARRKAVRAIVTPEQFAERQKQVREALFRVNGPFPERAPLHPQVVGSISRDGYTIEKVVYQSRPGVYVTGNLYLPKEASATNRVPGVLVPCGHSANGKAAEPYQSICISLALNGMAALIYDPIGQGERVQLLSIDGKPHAGSTAEHTLTGVGGWLVGTGTANYRIWDGIRSLDYLAGRPEVDPTKLGCTGNSGGGTLTSYLMAFDERIFAAAPSCYLTTLERLFDTIGPQDAEQNFPGQVALGIDHADYIALRALRPTLMCVGTQDYFDVDGAWTTFREAKGVYGLLGHPERMDLIEYNDKHGFSLPRRQAAMRFLRRWLVGQDDNPAEPALTLSTDADLQCTKSGQVVLEFDDAVTVFQLSQQRNRALAAKRAELWKEPSTALNEARRLSGVRAPDDPLLGKTVVDVIRTVSDEDAAACGLEGIVEVVMVERQEHPTKDETPNRPAAGPAIVIQRPPFPAPDLRRFGGTMPVPALLVRPKGEAGASKRPAAVLVSSNGKANEAGADGRIARLVADGKIVLALDVRGWGETSAAGDAAKNRDPWFGGDFPTAMLAIHLNRPLLGQRAEDVIAAARWLASHDDVDASAIEVIGVEHAGPVALHAAAFEPRIASVTLVSSIRSWSEVVDEPASKNQLQNVVPFALECYDLPDLAKAIAPRKVTIIDAVNPRGE